MMPTHSIVLVHCTAVVDGVVHASEPVKPVSKLSSAWARRVARKQLLDFVAKACETPNPSPPTQCKLLSVVKFSSPPVNVPVATMKDTQKVLSNKITPATPTNSNCWQCPTCTYEQLTVKHCRMCIMCHATYRSLQGQQHVGKRKAV